MLFLWAGWDAGVQLLPRPDGVSGRRVFVGRHQRQSSLHSQREASDRARFQFISRMKDRLNATPSSPMDPVPLAQAAAGYIFHLITTHLHSLFDIQLLLRIRLDINNYYVNSRCLNDLSRGSACVSLAGGVGKVVTRQGCPASLAQQFVRLSISIVSKF